MSRLSTKQRRARRWRRSWVEHVRLIREDWTPDLSFTRETWHEIAPDMASYSQHMERTHLGRIVPGPFIRTKESTR